MINLDNNNHSVFLLQYMLILPTKQCKNLITKDVSEYLKSIFERISKEYNISLIEWYYEPNYLKIIFKGHPNSQITKFINSFKASSSRLVKKEFKVKQESNDTAFWAKSFCLTTVGNQNDIDINEYLDKQSRRI